MQNHLRQCPLCGNKTLYRRADMTPNWKCDYCEEYFDDEDLYDIDKLDEMMDLDECDTLEEYNPEDD